MRFGAIKSVRSFRLPAASPAAAPAPALRAQPFFRFFICQYFVRPPVNATVRSNFFSVTINNTISLARPPVGWLPRCRRKRQTASQFLKTGSWAKADRLSSTGGLSME